MCGITACVGVDDAAETLLTGLQNLEYRGYDSAGVALRNGSHVDVRKCEGEVAHLERAIEGTPPEGNMGIGHTRWSTHGPPTDENAHPHTDCTETVAVVHNGIIENHDELREDLEKRGHVLNSDTDTEVVPHLVEEFLADGDSPRTAFRRAVAHLSGSYAIVMLVQGSGTLYATRHGSPLVLGIGDDRHYLASDVPAFLERTDQVVYLEDGDLLSVTATGYAITDGDGYHVDRPVRTVEWTPEDAEKGGYDHYMLKEINEQPAALRRTLRERVDPDRGAVTVDELDEETLRDVSAVRFVACGTSYHAALYGAQLLSKRGVPASATLASEFVTSPPPLDDDTLVVGVTQSGETADTLGALREAIDRDVRTLGLTNVIGSTAARECHDAMFIRAGPEIGVAATKTFSSQVAALVLLAERIADDVSGATQPTGGDLYEALYELPDAVETIVETTDARSLAESYGRSDAYFFVGRGVARPVAKEGALKLKEISYEHAEGFAAGELKHGPLALVTADTPVFAIATGRHEDKLRSNVEEIQARGAPVIAVAGADSPVADVADDVLTIPSTHPELAGALANVQLQLVAYHTATLLDRPIDKPRNLAKSVTVE